MKWLNLTASLFFVSFAQASTTAYFVDECSKEEIVISTPNDTLLRVQMTDLNPSEAVELKIKFRPAGEISDLRDNSQSLGFSYTLSPEKFRHGDYSGLFKIPKKKWLKEVEKANDFYRVWDAEIFWVQTKSNKTGSTVATFYHAPEKEVFYQIVSPGLCQWEEEAKVASKLYENNTTAFMNVMRETTMEWDRTTMNGISFGFNRNHGGGLPVGMSQLGSNFGWFFKSWEKQVAQREIIALEKKYVLNKEESGVFISRMSFNRNAAIKYKWSYKNSYCGKYEPVTQGYLDVGIITEDFMVIPPHVYPRPEMMQSMINVIRPAVNTCKDSIDLRPHVATDFIQSSNNGIIYFYDLNRSFP